MYLKKALRGTIIAFAFTVLAGAAWYLFRFLLARKLSLYEFGLFYAIVAFYSFFNLFVDAGFSQAVPKFIIDFKEKKDADGIRKVLLMSLAFQLIVSMFLFLLVYLFSDFLSARYFHTDVSEYLLLMGIWFITVPFSYLFGHIFIGMQKYGWASSIEFARVAATLAATWLFFSMGVGFYAPVFAYAAVNIILLIIYVPYSSRLVKFARFGQKAELSLFSSLIRFGFFVSISSIMWVILSQADTLLLTYFLGVEAVGLYQAAVPLASMAMYLITAITVVSYPLAAELHAKKKLAELSGGINLFYRNIFFILVPFLMILFAFSESIIYVLFGPDFAGASTALKILTVGALFSSLTMFNNNVISAIGIPKSVAKMMLIVAGINIALCVVLIPYFGINGAAAATATAFFAGAIISLQNVRRHIKIAVPVWSWIKTIAAGAIMILLIQQLKNFFHISSLWGNAGIACIALVIYCALVLLFGIVRIKELKELSKNIF